MADSSIVIVGAKRTAIGSLLGQFTGVPATQLGATAIKAALEHARLAPDQVTAVFMGNVLPAGLGQAPARQAAIGAGVPTDAACTTVSKVCGSGMQAVMFAHDAIVAGSADVVVAGGMESMTNAPHLLPNSRVGTKYGPIEMLDHMAWDGLVNPYDKQAMGVFGEQCVAKYAFTREEQDAFASESVRRAVAAQGANAFADEIAAVVVAGRKGDVTITTDEEPARCDLGKVASLKPAFKKDGTITAASSSKISDGAAATVLMRASDAAQRGIAPLARIVAHATHSQAPEWFTTAPVGALKKVLDDNPNLLATWVAFEPNAFDGKDAEFVKADGHDDTGRFVPYLARGAPLTPLTDYTKPGLGDYYLLAHDSGEEQLLEPYPYVVNGQEVLITSAAVPIVIDGKVIGVAGIDLLLEGLNTILGEMKPFETGSVSLISNGGLWAAYHDPKSLGKPIQENTPTINVVLDAIKKGERYEMTDFSSSLDTDVTRIFVPVAAGLSNDRWSVMVNLPQDKMQAPVNKLTNTVLLVSGIIVVSLAIIIALLVRYVATKPIHALTGAVEGLAGGNTSLDVPLTTRRDELGVMALAIDFFKEKLIEVDRLRDEQKASEQRLATERRKAMLDLADTPRQGDLDGRGNLSLRALEELTFWVLRVALDQVIFMTGQFDLGTLGDRLRRHTERQDWKAVVFRLPEQVMLRGELAREEAAAVTGVKERAEPGAGSALDVDRQVVDLADGRCPTARLQVSATLDKHLPGWPADQRAS